MYLTKIAVLLWVFLSVHSQRISLWKRYKHTPGKLNCDVDGIDIKRITKEIFGEYCVARIVNETNVYAGNLRTLVGNIVFTGESNGRWFTTEDLSQVEVLDVKQALRSWIPNSLNPPDAMLIDAHEPFSSHPRKFICRNKPNTLGMWIVSQIGFLENGICYVYHAETNYTSEFEVLSLNGISKFYYDYGVSAKRND